MTHNVLKTGAAVLLLALLAWSCASSYKDEFAEIQDRIDRTSHRIDSIINSVNSEIEALTALVRALEEKDYISSVERVSINSENDGWRIRFFKGGEITIIDGKDGTDGTDGKDFDDTADGHTPIIGARQDVDGKWYWTIDGEWIFTQEGTKICLSPNDGADGGEGPAGDRGKDGVTPLLKIEEGIWYLSVDGGDSWTEYGPATGADGKDGSDGIQADTIFEDIHIEDGCMVFVLKNGEIIRIPLNSNTFSLILSQKDNIFVTAGGVETITYEILGYDGETTIICRTEGGWDAQVVSNDAFSGSIVITAPDPFCQPGVTVLASTAEGYFFIEELSFTELR